MTLQPHDRTAIVARPAGDRRLASVDQHARTGVQQPGARVTYVEAAVEAVRSADAPGAQPAPSVLWHQVSTMSTNTRRLRLAPALLITARSAPAVRPPLPITLP